MKLTFYTVLLDKPGYPVRYMQSDEYSPLLLTGPFADPGKASQEFQAMIGTDSQCCYLDETAFRHKATALANLRRNRAKRQEALV